MCSSDCSIQCHKIFRFRHAALNVHLGRFQHILLTACQELSLHTHLTAHLIGSLCCTQLRLCSKGPLILEFILRSIFTHRVLLKLVFSLTTWREVEVMNPVISRTVCLQKKIIIYLCKLTCLMSLFHAVEGSHHVFSLIQNLPSSKLQSNNHTNSNKYQLFDVILLQLSTTFQV